MNIMETYFNQPNIVLPDVLIRVICVLEDGKVFHFVDINLMLEGTVLTEHYSPSRQT